MPAPRELSNSIARRAPASPDFHGESRAFASNSTVNGISARQRIYLAAKERKDRKETRALRNSVEKNVAQPSRLCFRRGDKRILSTATRVWVGSLHHELAWSLDKIPRINGKNTAETAVPHSFVANRQQRTGFSWPPEKYVATGHTKPYIETIGNLDAKTLTGNPGLDRTWVANVHRRCL